jgi:cation:H+ antiporter
MRELFYVKEKILEVLIQSGHLFIVLFSIVFMCVIFTNAIEHLGKELNLNEGVVGSILAAVGTALPETIVPLVAILGAYISGGNVHAGQEIGIGGILGAPFLLGTLAFFVTGLAVVIFSLSKRRTMEMPVNTTIMFRDLKFFAMAYAVAILASFVPCSLCKHFIAIFLIGLYVLYLYQTIKCDSSEIDNEVEDLDILYLTKFIKYPERFHLSMVIFQVILSILGIIFLAHLFVGQLQFFAYHFNINPMLLSLILTPIATELPEKFNSVIWIRAKKDTLALGNITGAMVFQSCIPTAVGVALTPWVLSIEGFINVAIVYLSVFVVYITIRKNKGILTPGALLSGGLFYLIYIIYIVLKIKGII